jgi:hypothetical protein
MSANKDTPHYFILSALGLAAAIILAACSGQSDGTALPTSPSSENSKLPNSSSHQGNVFGGLKACDVLDKALEGQGFEAAVVDKAGGDNGCDTKKARFGSVGLNLHHNQSIDDFNADPSKIHDGKVNNRSAVQIRELLGSSGDCAVAFEVTETSRAFIAASLSTGTTDEACEFATEVAKKVEPQLPKGN